MKQTITIIITLHLSGVYKGRGLTHLLSLQPSMGPAPVRTVSMVTRHRDTEQHLDDH